MVVPRKCASSLGEIILGLLVHLPGEAWGEVTWWLPHCPPRKAWGNLGYVVASKSSTQRGLGAGHLVAAKWFRLGVP